MSQTNDQDQTTAAQKLKRAEEKQGKLEEEMQRAKEKLGKLEEEIQRAKEKLRKLEEEMLHFVIEQLHFAEERVHAERELTRILNEQTRNFKEQTRNFKEQTRLERELTRILNEKSDIFEEQMRNLDEQTRNLDEQTRIAKEQARSLRLNEFLQGCHKLSRGLKIAGPGNFYTTTNRPVTNPTNRVYPQHMVPWTDFLQLQEEVWTKLSGHSFGEVCQFSSQDCLDKRESAMEIIQSEEELLAFEYDVERHVTEIIDAAYKDVTVRKLLGLVGEAWFQGYTDPFELNTVELNADMNRRPGEKVRRSFTSPLADRFCTHRRTDGSKVPVLAIRYKALHMLQVEQVTDSLKGNIQPKRDIINKKDSEDPQWLVLAVVTQLFSYLVTSNLRYGYVSTGRVYIFLRIDEVDPNMVQYYVSEPNKDAEDGKPDFLHHTAVAQIFAFTLQALAAKEPTLEWTRACRDLEHWTVHNGADQDVSSLSVHEETPMDSSYTLPSLQTPTEHKESHPEQINCASHADTAMDIGDRPFCTQRCLLGLARGGVLDANCPNVAAHAAHGPRHLEAERFLDLLFQQMTVDRGADRQCEPLNFRGYIAKLFKVRLRSYGYTLVAKATETVNRSFLVDELHVYDRLLPIQGQHVPVCLGMVHMAQPYYGEYTDGGAFRHFLLLSWGGQPLYDADGGIDGATAVAGVETAFRAIHSLGVLHRDAEQRNMLFDKDTGKVLVIDFDHSRLFRLVKLMKPKSEKRAAWAVHVLNRFQRELTQAMDRVR